MKEPKALEDKDASAEVSADGGDGEGKQGSSKKNSKKGSSKKDGDKKDSPKKDDGSKKDGDGEEKKPSKGSIVVYVIVAVILLAVIGNSIYNAMGGAEEADELTTSEFVAEVEDGMVKEVTYHAASATISGTYYADEAAKEAKEATDFTSTYLSDESLQELMDSHPKIKFTIDVTTNTWLTTLLTTLIPMLLIFGVLIYFLSQMNGMNNKQMQFGKTKAKKAPEETPKVRFKDVAGIDEAVEELREIKDYLSNPAKYQAMGAKIPRGVLLVGTPGCGKTLLARAVAGEAGVPFFSISGSDFVEMFVGVGASRVRDLFQQAKEAAPSIIFIDEIDAVGRQRGTGMGGGHDEREQTLNQLLVEMDGFESSDSVIMIAATNRADILDPALLRPGRFDRQVVVDRPDVKGREEILRVHANGKPIDKDVDFKQLAGLTAGLTGADLANLLNESALLAARRNKYLITNDEIMESLERVIAGPERKGRVLTDEEKRTIAYHESGHALVGHLLKHCDPVKKITIIPRGQALGYTLSIPEEDRFLETKSRMTDELAMYLGGRVSEEIVNDGDITTGASNDLERATKQAKAMVTRYGMSDVLGHQVYGEREGNPFLGKELGSAPDYSEQTADAIDAEVTRLMQQAHDTAYEILSAHREQLDVMAGVLIERETVDGKACQMLLDDKWDEYLEWEAAHPEELDKNKGLKPSGGDANALPEGDGASPEEGGKPEGSPEKPGSEAAGAPVGGGPAAPGGEKTGEAPESENEGKA